MAEKLTEQGLIVGLIPDEKPVEKAAKPEKAEKPQKPEKAH